MRTAEPESDTCPLCDEPNDCWLVKGKSSCWCFTVKIPKPLLDTVPEPLRGKACICARCIEKTQRQSTAHSRFSEIIRKRSE